MVNSTCQESARSDQLVLDRYGINIFYQWLIENLHPENLVTINFTINLITDYPFLVAIDYIIVEIHQ